MGFEFQALQDQLVQMKREILELKRFASSGVVANTTVRVASTGGTITWDAPDGGMYANILRVNQWADIQFTGNIASASSPSGVFAMRLPWPVVGAHPSQYTPLGSFDCSHSGSFALGTFFLFGNAPGYDITMWTVTSGISGLAQVQATSPWTWAAGDNIRGNLRVRIAPGF